MLCISCTHKHILNNCLRIIFSTLSRVLNSKSTQQLANEHRLSPKIIEYFAVTLSLSVFTAQKSTRRVCVITQLDLSEPEFILHLLSLTKCAHVIHTSQPYICAKHHFSHPNKFGEFFFTSFDLSWSIRENLFEFNYFHPSTNELRGMRWSISTFKENNNIIELKSMFFSKLLAQVLWASQRRRKSRVGIRSFKIEK